MTPVRFGTPDGPGAAEGDAPHRLQRPKDAKNDAVLDPAAPNLDEDRLPLAPAEEGPDDDEAADDDEVRRDD